MLRLNGRVKDCKQPVGNGWSADDTENCEANKDGCVNRGKQS